MQCVAEAKEIRFLRFVLTFLLLAFALSEWIEFIYGVLILSILTFLFGTRKSMTSYFLAFISRYVNTSVDYKQERSFLITRSVELFQEGLRSLFSLLIIYLYFQDNITGAVSIAYIVGILMMIASFFGFCVSGILYIALAHLVEKFRGKKVAK